MRAVGRHLVSSLPLVAALGFACMRAEAPESRAAERWIVDTVPAITIGYGQEAPEYQLHRVVGATRLSDGRIVVADGGSSQIRFYSPEGTFLSASGGDGEGPGELRQLIAMTRMQGDSIAVLSLQPGVTVFDPSGSLVRQRAVANWGFGVECMMAEANWHLLPDASLLFVFEDNLGIPGCPPMPNGLWRSSALVARYERGRPQPDTVAEMPGAQHGRGGYYRVFGHILAIAFSDDRIYLADTGADSIHTVSFAGHSGPSYQIPFGVREVPAVAKKQVRHRRERRDGSTELGEPYEYPTAFPRMSRMIAARNGYLWVAQYPEADQPIDSWVTMFPAGPAAHQWKLHWKALNRAGEVVAELQTPANLFPFEIEESYVLGLTWNELDVEAVQLYRVER